MRGGDGGDGHKSDPDNVDDPLDADGSEPAANSEPSGGNPGENENPPFDAPGSVDFSASSSGNDSGAHRQWELEFNGGHGSDDVSESESDDDDLDELDDEDIEALDAEEGGDGAGFWGDGPFGMFGWDGDEWNEEDEEMWMHDDEFLGDLDDDDDDFSDASTIEPNDEAEACDRAIEATANRHLLHPPTPYALPSSSFHFQSADALAVASDPHFPGSTLIATMDTDGVLLFRMPNLGSMTQAGGPPQHMQFIGGVESPSQSAYSMEISPSGKYLITGGEEGALEIYLIDSKAPQRPPIPSEVNLSVSEQQPFFYLPVVPPETDWVTGSRPRRVAQEVHEFLTAPRPEQVQHANMPPTYPRTLNDARFLNALGFRDTAILTSENAEEMFAPDMPEGAEPTRRVPFGYVPRDLFYAAAVDEQVVGLEEQFKKFVTMIGGVDKLDWKMQDEVVEGEQGGPTEDPTTKEEEEKEASSQALPAAADLPQRGALSLGGMIILGYPNHAAAVGNTTNEDGMVNGVRFGIVAGKERLLAAEQSGKVYVFEIPPEDTPIEDVAQSMVCAGLGDPSPHWSMQSVVVFSVVPNPFGSALKRRATVLSTATIGTFGVPLNMAAASPDGKWIAVVGDHKKVHLLDQSNGFADRELSFEPLRFDYDFLDTDLDVGSQYCTWNSSSTLLAVTSDALHAVFVFSVPAGDLVMRVEGFIRSVLPVTFAPWSDNVLLLAEESKMVHVRVVDLESGVVNYNAREGKERRN